MYDATGGAILEMPGHLLLLQEHFHFMVKGCFNQMKEDQEHDSWVGLEAKASIGWRPLLLLLGWRAGKTTSI